MSTQPEEVTEGEVITVARNALVELDPFEQQLQEFRRRYDGVVYDMNDPAQNKRARSDRLAIGKVVAELDRRHKAVKEPLLEATRLLDGRRREIKDGLLEVQGRVKTQIEAYEEIERKRVSELEARVQEIREMALPTVGAETTSGVWGNLLALAEGVELDDSWQEFRAEAALAKTEAIASIRASLEAAKKHEAEQAELARLRAEKEARERAEREEKVRAEAEAKAKREAEAAARKEAERVERERREAEAKAAAAIAEEKRRAEEAERARRRGEEKAKAAAAKAERDAKEAAERAAKAERERIERERAAKEAEAERERQAEEKRKAKQAHRRKVEGEAVESLVLEDLVSADEARRVVEAIRDGKVRHVEIVY